MTSWIEWRSTRTRGGRIAVLWRATGRTDLSAEHGVQPHYPAEGGEGQDRDQHGPRA
jgi:hypothetical protein